MDSQIRPWQSSTNQHLFSLKKRGIALYISTINETIIVLSSVVLLICIFI